MAVDTRKFQYNNLARSVLAELIGPTTTEFDVEDGSLFPDTTPPGEFDIECEEIVPLVVWDEEIESLEIMYATAVSGNTLTVERGKEGTTALNFSAGAHVINAPTAGFFQQQVAVTSVATAPELTGALNSDGITYDLSWTASSVDADDELMAYDIYRDDGDGYGYAYLGSVSSATLSYNDTTADVTSGLTYTYYVQPRSCIGGAGTASNTVVTQATLWLLKGSGGNEFEMSLDGRAWASRTDQLNGLGWIIEAENFNHPTYSEEQSLWMSSGGSSQQVITSEDGQRWRPRNVNGATGVFRHAPLYLPKADFGDPDEGRWVIGTGNNSFNQIWYSDDSGKTWTQAVVGDGVSNYARVDVWSMAYSPTLQRIVATGDSVDATICIWYSDDGGETWTPVTEVLGNGDINKVIWDPDNEVFIACDDVSHLGYSSDGITWTDTGAVLPGEIDSIWHDPNRSRIYIYYRTENMYYTDDGGATLNTLATGAAGSFRGAGYDPVADRIIVTGADNEVVRRSDDGYATTTDAYGGIHDLTNLSTDIAVGRTPSPVRQHVMLAVGDCDNAGMYDAAFLRSYDGGETWWAIPVPESGIQYNSVAYSPELDRWVVTCINGVTSRAYYSDDNGDTWTASNIGTGQTYGALRYQNGYFIALHNGSQETDSVRYSADGINWTTADFSGAYAAFEAHDCVYCSGLNGGVFVVVGTAGGAQSTIYCSDITADSWSAASTTGAASATLDSAMYDSTRNRLVTHGEIAGTGRYTSDLTGGWSTPSAIPGKAAYAFYDDLRDIYVAAGDIGGYYSEDGGDNWTTGGDTHGFTVYNGVGVKFTSGRYRHIMACSSGNIIHSESSIISNFENFFPDPLANFSLRGIAWNGVEVRPLTTGTSWSVDLTGRAGFPAHLRDYFTLNMEGQYASATLPEGVIIDNWVYSATQADMVRGTLNMNLTLDMTDIGFSCTLYRANYGTAVASACGFGVVDDLDDCGDPYIVAASVSRNASTKLFENVRIGYSSNATSGLTDFANSSGPYTLSGTEDDLDLDHTLSWGINGTTMYVYWDARLLDSFELTAGEQSALAAQTFDKVGFGAFVDATLSTLWGELRGMSVGDFTVAG